MFFEPATPPTSKPNGAGTCVPSTREQGRRRLGFDRTLPFPHLVGGDREASVVPLTTLVPQGHRNRRGCFGREPKSPEKLGRAATGAWRSTRLSDRGLRVRCRFGVRRVPGAHADSAEVVTRFPHTTQSRSRLPAPLKIGLHREKLGAERLCGDDDRSDPSKPAAIASWTIASAFAACSVTCRIACCRTLRSSALTSRA